MSPSIPRLLWSIRSGQSVGVMVRRYAPPVTQARRARLRMAGKAMEGDAKRGELVAVLKLGQQTLR